MQIKIEPPEPKRHNVKDMPPLTLFKHADKNDRLYLRLGEGMSTILNAGTATLCPTGALYSDAIMGKYSFVIVGTLKAEP